MNTIRTESSYNHDNELPHWLAACTERVPGLSDESSRTPFFLAGWVRAASEEGAVRSERGESQSSGTV